MPQGGKRLGAGRPAGRQNKVAEALKANSVRFFDKLIDDETEAKFWRYFMTGWMFDEETHACIPLPLNRICFDAFKRAIEYKRGMPIQTKEPEGILQPMDFDDLESPNEPSQVNQPN